MGKAKKRLLNCNNKANRGLKKETLYSNTSSFMTREGAINQIFRLFSDNSQNGFEQNSSKLSSRKYLKNKKALKGTKGEHNDNFRCAFNTISLFGITAEELSEAGVSYENLRACSSLLS